MIFIAALTTGAAVVTNSPAQTQVESDILIGDIDTASPLAGLKVNIDGNTTIDVQGSNPLMVALAKLSQFVAGAPTIGLLIKIATGRLFSKATTVSFTNNGATTPAVYWNSQKTGGRPITAKTTTINPASPGTFQGSDFAYLALTSLNVTSYDFTFTDGTQQNMTIVEVDALFAKTNETEANGRLDPLISCIDNTRGNIASVKINAGITSVTVMLVK